MTENENITELLAMTPEQLRGNSEAADYGVLRVQNAALLGLVTATTMPEFVGALIEAEVKNLKTNKANKHAIASAEQFADMLLHALQANRNRQ